MPRAKGGEKATKQRPVPRPFEMHWGRGQIVEEASWTGPHHEPTIQLMQYDDGEAAGERDGAVLLVQPQRAVPAEPADGG